MDRLLDAAESAVSVGVRQLCCRLGLDARSFARGAENLKQAAQLSLSQEYFRQIVESEGKAVLKASQEEVLEPGWSASQCQTTATPDGRPVTRVYASADGVLVPTTTQEEKDKRRATTVAKRQKMTRKQRRRLARLRPVKRGSDQRYKQVYLTMMYDQGCEHRLVGVTRGDHEALGKLLRRDAARIHLRAAEERVGLVDGAVCLRHHLEGLPLQVVVLDFQHLAGHVNEASRRTLGEGTAEGLTWSEKALHAARHEGYGAMLECVLALRGPLRGNKRKAADGLLNYVSERRAMIVYDQCEAKGQLVATGGMESECGVTTERVKGQGRRWDLDNAESMMALEALMQSGQWNPYCSLMLAKIGCPN